MTDGLGVDSNAFAAIFATKKVKDEGDAERTRGQIRQGFGKSKRKVGEGSFITYALLRVKGSARRCVKPDWGGTEPIPDMKTLGKREGVSVKALAEVLALQK